MSIQLIQDNFQQKCSEEINRRTTSLVATAGRNSCADAEASGVIKGLSMAQNILDQAVRETVDSPKKDKKGEDKEDDLY